MCIPVSKPGELFYPMEVCVERYVTIFVADANNYLPSFRVQPWWTLFRFSDQGYIHKLINRLTSHSHTSVGGLGDCAG